MLTTSQMESLMVMREHLVVSRECLLDAVHANDFHAARRFRIRIWREAAALYGFADAVLGLQKECDEPDWLPMDLIGSATLAFVSQEDEPTDTARQALDDAKMLAEAIDKFLEELEARHLRTKVE